MFAFLDKLMAFVEKHYTLTYCFCMGFVLLCLIGSVRFDVDDWVFLLCMVPLNLLSWPLLIIWWREFRQGKYAARTKFVIDAAPMPALITTVATLALLFCF